MSRRYHSWLKCHTQYTPRRAQHNLLLAFLRYSDQPTFVRHTGFASFLWNGLIVSLRFYCSPSWTHQSSLMNPLLSYSFQLFQRPNQINAILRGGSLFQQYDSCWYIILLTYVNGDYHMQQNMYDIISIPNNVSYPDVFLKIMCSHNGLKLRTLYYPDKVSSAV